MLRHPKTTQEKRFNGRRCGNIDEYGVRLRAKRSLRNLPDTYDDIFRGDYNHRSWKRHRRTQYHDFVTKRRKNIHNGEVVKIT